MAMIDSGPAPIQTMNTGPSAVFGSALSTTRYGSSTRESSSLHHRPMAMSVPKSVPSTKPTTTSRHDVPMCSQSSPEFCRPTSVCTTRDGLLTMKASTQPSRAESSHQPRNAASSRICSASTSRLRRRSARR